ncbi:MULTISPECIES: hypothetical protein [unclassified Sporosarcina]|uniref:hypothetical protein n=1 Tax=unclassified Sporosarcina TaxID=2647733 RepID=UPI001A927905|nr:MULTISPECIES: hypothetical protein [unclassified Sporosarcina]MBO0587587.1 hypothetical protein [Sporosarcina sp. E16_8]MBO0602425.1 hypothetical protein [Sporosarcina sp. E16_3]
MKYVGINDFVIYKREKTKVVELVSGAGNYSAFLEKENGEIMKVKVLDIVWNGSTFFVSPNGVKRAEVEKDTQTVLKGVRRDLAVWDRENPKPRGMDRINALDSMITEHIGVLVKEINNDEILGQVVRAIFKEIYFEES